MADFVEREAMAGPGKPIPLPDELSRPYWEGAREHVLRIMHCESCGFFVHYPERVCPRCQSRQVAPAPVSGRGVIHSYTVTHHQGAPGFQDEVPFVVALVELAEQPGLRLIANIRGCSTAEVRIGMAVEVVFEEVLPGVTLPQFRAQADSTR
jgi:uncharacterized OB-fold protein